jgi:hypothetical protein
MNGSVDRLHQWIFLLPAGLLFTATVLRSVLAFAGDPYLTEALLLLLAWLVLFLLEAYASARRTPDSSSRWGPFFPADDGSCGRACGSRTGRDH